MNRDAMLRRLTILDFMLLDLALFLNTHNEDKEALRKYNLVAEEADRVRSEYEQNYGPLVSFRSKSIGEWKWPNSPWPWNKEFNFQIREEK